MGRKSDRCEFWNRRSHCRVPRGQRINSQSLNTNYTRITILLQVAGLARRSDLVEKKAKELSGKTGKLYAIKTDLAKEEDILNALKWIEENLGHVHILINNAGLFKDNLLRNGDSALWKQIFDVNVLGLCIATREAVKIMSGHNINGHIIHINSVVGHKVLPFPGSNVYPASKHAVTALTETLRHELNAVDSKIKTTVSFDQFVLFICDTFNCRVLVLG